MTTRNGRGNFLSRQPFALVGALALLSLAQDLLALHSWIDAWIDAWQAITRPVWDFVFGSIFDWFGVSIPDWLKDYFTVGLIVFGMEFRSWLYEQNAKYEIPEDQYEYTGVFFLMFKIFAFRGNNPFFHAIGLLIMFLEALFFWWGIIFRRVYFATHKIEGDSIEYAAIRRDKLYIFAETLIWIFIIIAVSYAVISY